jgi:hypothetical protein
VTSKLIYKIKNVAHNSIEIYTDSLVAIRFSHQEGEDYDQTIYPVSRRSVHKSSHKIHEKDSHVYRLNKSLHGPKQEPRA